MSERSTRGEAAIALIEAQKALTAAAERTRHVKYADLSWTEQRKLNREFSDAEATLARAEDAYEAATKDDSRTGPAPA